MVKIILILITFSFIIGSLVCNLIVYFSILFEGYIFIVEHNIFILIFEICVFLFTLTYFIYLIPKIMRKVDNEI